MNGLEEILLKIEQDGNARAEEIIKAAKLEAEEKKEHAKKEAELDAAKIISEAEKKAEIISESGKSGAEAYIKRAVLSAKSEIIDSAVTYAQNEIINSDKYFDMLFMLIIKNAHNEQGILQLNERDKKNMPKDFLQKVNAALPEGGSLTVSEKTSDINGGCIIAYGGIEENCAVSELIAEKSDIIKDKLYQIIK